VFPAFQIVGPAGKAPSAWGQHQQAPFDAEIEDRFLPGPRQNSSMFVTRCTPDRSRSSLGVRADGAAGEPTVPASTTRSS